MSLGAGLVIAGPCVRSMPFHDEGFRMNTSNRLLSEYLFRIAHAESLLVFLLGEKTW